MEPLQPSVHSLKNEIQTATIIEVRQQMTPYALTVNRLEADMATVKTTLYGNPAIQQVGLVEQVKSIDSKLDTIIDQRKQMFWLMRGMVAGLVLNFAQQTGWLPAIIKTLSGP